MSSRESARLLGSSRILAESSDGSTSNLGEYKKLNDRDRLELRLTRRFILEIFETTNLDEVFSISKNKLRKEKSRTNFVNRYCEMLGFHGSYEERVALIQNGFGNANNAIMILEDPQTGILRHLRGYVGTMNEISIINDPIDLLMICFSPKASKRMRYEARRKLVLCDLAIRSNINNKNIESRLDSFSRFLGQNIWSDKKTGELESVEALSYHSPVNYACKKVRILKKGEKTTVSEFIQYHRFGMRSWKTKNGREKKVMIEHRGKTDAAQMIKLLRKDTKNINSIDDVVGFKMTFMNKNDIYEFLEKLQIEANRIGTTLLYEEIYDTIDNGDDFRITNPGSSNKLEIIKVHLQLNGSLVELQMHTIRSFIDSRLHDEYGFEEYALNRLFQKGKYNESVVELLYPHDIYGTDISLYYDELAADIRENKRVRSSFLPKERSLNNLKIIRYSDSDLAADANVILSKLEEIPDVIISIGHTGLSLGKEISMHIKGSELIIYNEQDFASSTIKKLKKKNILIVDNIGDDCKKIGKVKQIFPQAKVAVLGITKNPKTLSKIDHYAREIDKNEQLSFTWERGMKEQKSQTFALGLIWKKSGKTIQILFQQTPDGKLKLPGGRIEKTDLSIESGFEREMSEEMGKIRGTSRKLLDVSYNSNSDDTSPKSFVRFFEKEVSTNTKITKNNKDPEVSSLTWVSLEDAVTRLSTKQFKMPLSVALEKLTKVFIND